MSDPRTGTLVLGLGNPLMGDDGAGLAALRRLREEYLLPGEVQLVDGGTWGMNLLPLLETADQVLLLDAVDTGAAPGTVVTLEGEELPRYFALKLSPHQIDLREVLALAELRGTLPPRLAAVGVQPAEIEMRTGLSPVVEAALDAVVAAAAARLATWGVACGLAGAPAHA